MASSGAESTDDGSAAIFVLRFHVCRCLGTADRNGNVDCAVSCCRLHSANRSDLMLPYSMIGSLSEGAGICITFVVLVCYTPRIAETPVGFILGCFQPQPHRELLFSATASQNSAWNIQNLKCILSQVDTRLVSIQVFMSGRSLIGFLFTDIIRAIIYFVNTRIALR